MLFNAFPTEWRTTWPLAPTLKQLQNWKISHQKINLQKNSIIYIRKHLANYCQKLNELLKGFFGKNPLKKVQNCKTCPRYLFHWLLYPIVLFYLHLLYSFLVFETHYKEREVGWVPIAASPCSLSLWLMLITLHDHMGLCVADH